MTQPVLSKETSEKISQQWDRLRISNPTYRDLVQGRLRPLSMADILLASSLLTVLGLKEQLVEPCLEPEQEFVMKEIRK